ncbi:MAG: hypothetical protein IKB51_02900 [Clostridia bacterium]|nr:hypothetical protein [Clostridia bacterium]
MQKKISLLYKNGVAGEIEKSIEQALYNLNIDRMTRAACDKTKQADYFLSVLCRRCVSEENALYRAAILKDFIKYPNLLASLSQLFRGYENLPDETEEVIKEIFRYGAPVSASGMLDYAYEELYVNAHYARNVIAYFSEIYELFSGYEVESEGLLQMKSFCVSMSESKCIDELEKAAERFRSESVTSYRFSVDATLDEAMRICSCSISDVTDASAKEKKGIFSKFRKNQEVSVDIGGSSADNAGSAVSIAMGELSGIFSDLASGIYSVFKGIGEELMFYSVALDIADRLKKSGMTYCFPEVLSAEKDVLTAEGIYDMLLLNEGKDKRSIVANSVSLEKSILARGDNNCGKTSFLRSVGSAVLFAQNGLFVCAESMRVSVRSAIFTHFSSAEKDFTDGDAAGRFEGEVKEIAEIMDSIRPYSLVLLNETFQTTAYREGAQGMKDILNALTAFKCRYVFVTHMKAIFSHFTNEQVSILNAVGFKLIPSEDGGVK